MLKKFSRRSFLRKITAGTAGMAFLEPSFALDATSAVNKRMNILYIMTDEQPVSCVGAFGNPAIKTPNLDQLAKQGCKLEKMYIASFPCSPSRTSQFTGRYLHNHNVFSNDVLLDAKIPSLGTICNKAGYNTAYFGKWHLGGYVYRGVINPDSSNAGTLTEWYYKGKETPDGWKKEITAGGFGEDYPQSGFVTWAGGWKQYHEWLEKNGQGSLLEKYKKLGCHRIAPATDDSKHDYSQVPERFHVEAFISGQACDFLKKQADNKKPWCTVVSFYGPHSPVAPPKPWDQMYSLDLVKLPANHNDKMIDKPLAQKKSPKYALGKWTDDQFKDYIRRYWGFCSYIDKQIGRVFETLHQTGQWDNTIIVFTSDHGDMITSHGFFYKMCVNGYDELFRVPTIVKIPKVTKAGSSSKSFVSHVDMLPTLLESVGINIPKAVDGKSFVPLLKNTKKKHRDFIFSDGCNRSIMCCDNDYKFVLNWATKDVDNELYDLKKDPGELCNLFFKPEQAAMVEKMTNRIMDWLDETHHKYKDLIAKKAGITKDKSV